MTQFELATAAAFVALAAARVEAAAIEAGLGGRLDATNTIPSRVTVLTSVGLDHTEWLGETEEEIAAEKLAVLRDHTTLVLGRVSPAVRGLAERAAAERGADLIVAPEDPGAGGRAARAGPLPAPQLRPRLRGRRGVPRRAGPGRGGRGGGHADDPRPARAGRRAIRRPSSTPPTTPTAPRPWPRRCRGRRRPPGRRLPGDPRRQGRRGDGRGRWRPALTRAVCTELPTGGAGAAADFPAPARMRRGAGRGLRAAGLAAEAEADFAAAVAAGARAGARAARRDTARHRLALRAGAGRGAR